MLNKKTPIAIVMFITRDKCKQCLDADVCQGGTMQLYIEWFNLVQSATSHVAHYSCGFHNEVRNVQKHNNSI